MNQLSRDVVLIVIDVQQAFDNPKWGQRNNPSKRTSVTYWQAGVVAQGTCRVAQLRRPRLCSDQRVVLVRNHFSKHKELAPVVKDSPPYTTEK
jgi:hypothetical protein